MITEEHLADITAWLKDNVMRNSDIMLSDANYEYDLPDIIASLHNLLYEAVTGKRYGYMHHWANKIGCFVTDNFFDYPIGFKGGDDN